MLSIVTPSLNQGAWIGENLSSVRANARRGLVEHWVVDGGSTDGTRAMLAGQDFANWISEPDEGQSDAINKGLVRCGGEILTYLCADDYLEDGAVERVLGIFAQFPEVDVVYGDGYFLESNSGWKRRKVAGPYSWNRLRAGNFLIQPAVFWRRRVWERHGPFDVRLRYCMDHEYWLRLGPDTRWFYLQEPLATCRLHADAKTSRALAEAWREAALMQKRYGILWRPRLDALWMAVAGQHYYRLKRLIFARVGKKRRKS